MILKFSQEDTQMEDVEKLIKTSLGEIEHLLSSKTVVGEPITVQNSTIIPLIAIGFAFGAGGGSGKGGTAKENEGEGTGGAAGGGGGIKPTAVIIVDENGVRVEPVKGQAATVAEKMADALSKVVSSRRGGKQKED
jgi:uncharacterized spore protein YtfJ